MTTANPSITSAASRASDRRLVRLSAADFRERFNRNHFMFEHGLSGHPLFELPRLIELACDTARTRPKDLYYDEAVTDLNQRWSGLPPTAAAIDETIRRIDSRQAWIILRYADTDPAYQKVLQTCIQDVLQVGGRQLEKTMRKKEVIVFITSPRRLTTYHIDSECNFLLQVHGDKQINVFRNDDREVVTEDEVERFWAVDPNAARYKPDLQDRADVVMLKPGKGIHIPINAGHWLQNGDNVSVSVSINWHPYDSERGDVYCVNHYLRKHLGLNPTPPFQSPVLDAIKRPMGAALRRIRQAVRGPVSNR